MLLVEPLGRVCLEGSFERHPVVFIVSLVLVSKNRWVELHQFGPWCLLLISCCVIGGRNFVQLFKDLVIGRVIIIHFAASELLLSNDWHQV